MSRKSSIRLIRELALMVSPNALMVILKILKLARADYSDMMRL